jgi:hypothetical protein
VSVGEVDVTSEGSPGSVGAPPRTIRNP